MTITDSVDDFKVGQIYTGQATRGCLNGSLRKPICSLPKWYLVISGAAHVRA